MAEHDQKALSTEAVVTDVPLADNLSIDSDEKQPLKPISDPVEQLPATPEVQDFKSVDKVDDKMPQSGSFKEESTKVADLPDPDKKSLQELKRLIREALDNHEFTTLPSPPVVTKEVEEDKEKPVVAEEKEEPSKEGTDDHAQKPQPEATERETKEQGQKDDILTPPVQTEHGKVVVAAVTEEKVAVQAADTVPVDDDGAKTVEAIEETIVAVSSVVPSQQPPPSEAGQLTVQPPEMEKEAAKIENVPPPPPEEVSIWGIPLLADERSDVVLLKFLRARDFKVKDAFTMIKNTVRWRKEFKIEELMEEDLGNDLDKVVFMHGFDKEGHPVCYNVYGEFRSKELYQKTFSDEEKRQKFLRRRIQFLEKSIRKLDFTPGGISTIVQVNDLKNSPGPGKWELRQATKQALQLLQDNYPEFVAKQVFINVPWWYLAVNRMMSPFLTQRTKSKFVFAGPSKSAESLLRYIAAEQLPVKYGGLSNEGEFGMGDSVTEVPVKPASKHTVEIPVNEASVVNWEVRVVGWEVSYGAEFVPSAEGSYTVIIQKARKVSSTSEEEAVVSNSFKIGEAGKVVLTIHNPTSKKKLLLYRLKINSSH